MKGRANGLSKRKSQEENSQEGSLSLQKLSGNRKRKEPLQAKVN
jgi:hypothetical protein